MRGGEAAPAAFLLPRERLLFVGGPRPRRALPCVQLRGFAPMHLIKVHGHTLPAQVASQPLGGHAGSVADLRGTVGYQPPRDSGGVAEAAHAKQPTTGAALLPEGFNELLGAGGPAHVHTLLGR